MEVSLAMALGFVCPFAAHGAPPRGVSTVRYSATEAALGAMLGKVRSELRGWDDIGRLLSGKPAARPGQKQLGESLQSPSAQWEKVHLGAVSVERVREFGEVYLPLALWHRLGLGKLLEELTEPGRGNVGWETVASVLLAARFCSQRSELGIAEEGDERTAQEDLLGVDKVRINDDRLYRALDVLGRHKDKLCPHLIEWYRDGFGARMEFLLNDVTSTFLTQNSAAALFSP